jgi:hypothetical protein
LLFVLFLGVTCGAFEAPAAEPEPPEQAPEQSGARIADVPAGAATRAHPSCSSATFLRGPYTLPHLEAEPFHAAESQAGGDTCGGGHHGRNQGEPTNREGWFRRVSRTQSEQPHWITPLVTVTPRLEEEYRFDAFWQHQPDGSTATVYGGGKGLELIPADHLELILGVPPYNVHSRKGARDGWGDVPLLLKYRVFARNEEEGDYILTLFLGASVPTASTGNGPGRAILSPAVAFGKGWRNFDFQSTVGVGLPAGDIHRLGTPWTYNTAFQYRIFKKLWPGFEVNSTWWPNGQKDGKKQIFLTPELLVGRLPVWRRLGFTLGIGVQIDVTQYHSYDHNWIISMRLPF